MGGEELGFPDLRRRLGGKPTGFHEAKGFGDPVGEFAVFLPLRALFHEPEIPPVHPVKVGKAAVGEGAQQIEGRGRLAIGLQPALRIGRTGLFGELHRVDHVAAVTRQAYPVLGLEIIGPGLDELARHAADLDHRQARAVGQHHRHLQKHAEGIADVVGMKFGEALGAVPTLEQEGPALHDLGEVLAKAPRFTGEYQGRKILELGLDLRERPFIRPLGLLLDRLAPPTVRRPLPSHHDTLDTNYPSTRPNWREGADLYASSTHFTR